MSFGLFISFLLPFSDRGDDACLLDMKTDKPGASAQLGLFWLPQEH